jgi:hypothetical protein
VPRSERIVLANPGAQVVEVHYGADAHRVRPGSQVEVALVDGRSRGHIDELLRIGLLRVVAPVAPVSPVPAPAKRAARTPVKKAVKKAAKKAAPAAPARSPRKRTGGS